MRNLKLQHHDGDDNDDGDSPSLKASNLFLPVLASLLLNKAASVLQMRILAYSSLMAMSLLRQQAVTVIPIGLLDFRHRVHDKRAGLYDWLIERHCGYH
jgi:hypothetical protein